MSACNRIVLVVYIIIIVGSDDGVSDGLDERSLNDARTRRFFLFEYYANNYAPVCAADSRARMRPYTILLLCTAKHDDIIIILSYYALSPLSSSEASSEMTRTEGVVMVCVGGGG